MPKLRVTDELDDLVEELIENDPDHYHLRQSGVTVAVLMHSSPNGLKLHGYDAAAIAKVTSQRERAQGCRDVTITIDEDQWNAMEDRPAMRKALIDHELLHFMPVIKDWSYHQQRIVDEKTGEVTHASRLSSCLDGEYAKKACTYKYDDLGRPKVAMRKHDIQEGWFLRMFEKYDAFSIEASRARAIRNRIGQLVFDFAVSTEDLLAEHIEALRIRHVARAILLPEELAERVMEEFEERRTDLVRRAEKGVLA